MKVEPAVDYHSLTKRIKELYDLPVIALSFIPEGECSIAFAVSCTGDQTYFLKLWPDDRLGQVIRAKLDRFLPITHEIHRRGLLTNLSAPIPNLAGELHSLFNEYALALFPFIEGQPITSLDDIWASGVSKQIAETMAKLHQSTPHLDTSLLPGSAFEINFSDDMRLGLDALDHVGQNHTSGQKRLRDVLLPLRASLMDQLDQLERLRPSAQKNAPGLVLCHTDMGGNNVLVSSSGKVNILDWDDLILAPAEQDLQEYRGSHFADFLDDYFRAGGIPTLDPNQFAFYLLRRYLGDLTDWLIRILYENSNPAQNAFDLEGIEDYCLVRLAHFDEEIQDIEKTINTMR